ncbi:MAG: cytidine deaminase [Bacteroidales bacterium]|nr:cytidine deaminase [Bacteroidales bacterium]
MNVKEVRITFHEYENEKELSQDEQVLLGKALQATDNSYAPYSEFHVGAAVLLEDGTVVIGSNQENAAYPSGLCAERVALFYAQSQYPGVKIKALAVSAKADHFHIEAPITPCGSCRQVIVEVEQRQKEKIRIIMQGETGPVHVVQGIEALLPFSFHEEKLKKKL